MNNQEEENEIKAENIKLPDTSNEQKNIRNVWNHNVEEEFRKISNLIDEGFTWIAMDTEFPGILYNYVIDNNSPEMGYRILKMNVDNLKLIQAGITLAKETGEKPHGIDTWQFNINYDLKKEKHHPESIKLLQEAGIDFDVLEKDGIDVMVFADLLMSSGLVINPNVYWITFHGTYDFSYLLKVLINNNLPQTSKEFLRYLRHVFPNIYDIKTMINEVEELKNHSLSRLGQEMEIARKGQCHQAGSDALLTLELFFEIYRVYFFKGIPDKYYNNIFGISQEGAFSNYQGNDTQVHNFQISYQQQQYYQNYPYYPDNQYQMDNFYYQNQQMQGQYFNPNTLQHMQNIQQQQMPRYNRQLTNQVNQSFFSSFQNAQVCSPNPKSPLAAVPLVITHLSQNKHQSNHIPQNHNLFSIFNSLIILIGPSLHHKVDLELRINS